MATYKVIQDIEAEDKILGPFTLRQFVFLLIAIFLFYICFVLVTRNAAFMLVVFLPPALFFGFFALPFGRDQPTEIWALAKLRFWLLPRRRIWNQSGVKQLVTITAPKKIEHVYTNGLSQTEVKSRLKALASTIDSRGWAIKNISSGSPYSYSYAGGLGAASDRLIDISSLPAQVPTDDTPAEADILDDNASPLAQQFASMIDTSSRTHRQELIDRLNGIRGGQTDEAPSAAAATSPATGWFSGPAAAQPNDTSATDDASEAVLADQLAHKTGSQKNSFGNLRTLRPLSQASSQPAADAGSTAAPSVTPPNDPAIIALAKNNDFNVATLARQAQKSKGDSHSQGNDEVVISLH